VSWLTFIVCMWWGGIVLACVRTVVGGKNTKLLEREIAQLRAEFNAQRTHERLAELESGQTGLRNRLESLKVVRPLGSKWGQ
jgi:hypothetical protein